MTTSSAASKQSGAKNIATANKINLNKAIFKKNNLPGIQLPEKFRKPKTLISGLFQAPRETRTVRNFPYCEIFHKRFLKDFGRPKIVFRPARSNDRLFGRLWRGLAGGRVHRAV